MLKIYGAALSSPSNKVRYVASAMGLEHEFIPVNLAKGEQRNPDFVAVNPFSRVPAINDDGFTLFESDAIITYLAEKTNSPLYSKDLKSLAIINQWMSFASQHIGQSMGRVFFNRLVCKFLGQEPDENSLNFGLRTLDSNLSLLDPILSKQDYLAGDALSLADFALIASLDPAELSQVDLSAHKNVTAYRKRLMAMDWYQNVHSHFGAEMGL